ncbi:IucA/IucC family protein [Staphylococcus gallinarum]|uniref:IucA/IucC family protein n=1 Tax=Staphylococcus gallinarum TaxID=1293 RepID=UPI001E4EA226|nr:IucA/IucC family protein [Staphylococcus gallinarum]MCD8903167.1 sialic acid synthase [Staphylococcus gallinarum]MEB6238001.1 sialic acid synthase [Staphylococcus gallinarum]
MYLKRNKHNLIENLTIDEQNAFYYLSTIEENWANQFKSVLLASRDKISQRLISSLHRENLVNSRDYSQIISTKSLNLETDIQTDEVLRIDFPKSSRTLIAPITGQHAFDRIDVSGPFYFEQDQVMTRVLHPKEILDCILIEAPELNNDASAQFLEDINNSVANMAIAISFQHHTLSETTAPLWELIDQHPDSYLRSEQSVVEGHPLHPGAKLRKGMTPETAINYSSEFAQPIPMKFILINKQITRTSALNNHFNDVVYQLFNGLYDFAVETVGQEAIDNYNVMVVHPWQFNEIIVKDYAQELKTQSIIPLNYQLNYFAGLSFRTLMPELPVTSPHIKLSTNVHITGEIRTLSEQTTTNGPKVTQILNNIKENDSLFHNINAETIDELAGIHFYNEADATAIKTLRSEQLGTLFRRNIYEIIDADVTPIIPSSLVANYPNNSEAPIISLIKKYTLARSFDNFEIASINWFKRYGQALIDIAIPLLVKYGIALEAHLQNSIVAFNKDGSLNTLYVRDFEGLRIDEPFLNSVGYSTKDFHEKSLILTDKAQTVFNKVFYSSIQNHLGELITAVAKYSDSNDLESQIWHTISDLIEAKLDQIEQTLTDSERVANFRDIIFAEKIDYKCVTTMRLEDEADYYTYVQVDNPLYKSK